jgi:hypothetical protein
MCSGARVKGQSKPTTNSGNFGPEAGNIQRGNNWQAICTSIDDMGAYAHWLAEGARRFDVAILGRVFMTNHVHLLATPGP